jgi:hypothetical protein
MKTAQQPNSVQMKMGQVMRPAAPPVYRPQVAASPMIQQRPPAPAPFQPAQPVQPKMIATKPVITPRPLVSIAGANLVQPKVQNGLMAGVIQPSAPRPFLASATGSAVQRGKRYKKGGYDADDEDDYVPPQGKKQKRFGVPKSTTEQVVRNTAHKRMHFNFKKHRAVYTCPGCRRPLGYDTLGGKLVLTNRNFRSKTRNKLHKQRTLQLDHFPLWADRERVLKGRGATDAEIRDAHNDPSGLRALCSVCNASHKYEKRKKIDYNSDPDEEGYMTPDDEPCNKGFYSPFRFDPPPPPPGAGGITT